MKTQELRGKFSQQIPNKKRNSSENIPIQLAMGATSFSLYLSQFLGTSQGRDKAMAVFQYGFDMYVSMAKHSNIESVVQKFERKQLLSVVVAQNLKESISQARKIYRIMRFLDEIKGMQRIIRTNKPPLFKLLSLSGHYASFMYYVSDNVLWLVGQLVQTNVIGEEVGHSWKQRKNTFSQMRIMVNILRITVILVMRESKERKLIYDLTQLEESFNVEKGSPEFKKTQSLLKLRRKRRFELLDLILSLMRFCMLTKSLKMAGYQYLNPIFIAICGLASALIAVFKAVHEKRIFIQLENLSKQPQERTASLYKSTGLKFDSSSTNNLFRSVKQ